MAKFIRVTESTNYACKKSVLINIEHIEMIKKHSTNGTAYISFASGEDSYIVTEEKFEDVVNLISEAKG